MPFCCGKDRESNFCPSCGKALDPKSGLRGCLAYITTLYDAAEKKAQGKESVYKNKTTAFSGWSKPTDREIKRYREEAEQARKKADRYKSWQEALIKAIDGE